MSMLEGKTLYLEYLGLDYELAFDLHLYHYTFRDQYNWAAQNGCTKIARVGSVTIRSCTCASASIRSISMCSMCSR